MGEALSSAAAWIASAYDWFMLLLAHQDAPDWAQAIGGALAIAAAFLIGRGQNRVAFRLVAEANRTKQIDEATRGAAFAAFLLPQALHIAAIIRELIWRDYDDSRPRQPCAMSCPASRGFSPVALAPSPESFDS